MFASSANLRDISALRQQVTEDQFSRTQRADGSSNGASVSVESLRKQLRISDTLLKQAVVLSDLITHDNWIKNSISIKEQVKTVRKTITLANMSQGRLDPFTEGIMSVWQGVCQSILLQLNQPHQDEIDPDFVAKRLKHQIGVDRIAIEELTLLIRAEEIFTYYISVREITRKGLSEYFTVSSLEHHPSLLHLNQIKYSSERNVHKVQSTTGLFLLDSNAEDNLNSTTLSISNSAEIIARGLSLLQQSAITSENVHSYIAHYDIHSHVWISSICAEDLGAEGKVTPLEISQKILETITTSPEFSLISSPIESRQNTKSEEIEYKEKVPEVHETTPLFNERNKSLSIGSSKQQKFRQKLLTLSPETNTPLNRSSANAKIQGQIRERLLITKHSTDQELINLRVIVNKLQQKLQLQSTIAINMETKYDDETTSMMHSADALQRMIESLLMADVFLLSSNPDFCATLFHQAQELVDTINSGAKIVSASGPQKSPKKSNDLPYLAIRFMIILSQISRLVESLSFDPSEFKSQRERSESKDTFDEMKIKSGEAKGITHQKSGFIEKWNESGPNCAPVPESVMSSPPTQSETIISASMKMGVQLVKKVMSLIKLPASTREDIQPEVNQGNLPSEIHHKISDTYQDDEFVICRICEENIPMSKIEEHSKICAQRRNTERAIQLCDTHLQKIIEAVSDKLSPQIAKTENLDAMDPEKERNIILSLIIKICNISLSSSHDRGQLLDKRDGVRALIDTLRALKSEPQNKRYAPITERTESVVNEKLRLLSEYHQPSLLINSSRDTKLVSIHDFDIIKLIRGGGFGSDCGI